MRYTSLVKTVNVYKCKAHHNSAEAFLIAINFHTYSNDHPRCQNHHALETAAIASPISTMKTPDIYLMQVRQIPKMTWKRVEASRWEALPQQGLWPTRKQRKPAMLRIATKMLIFDGLSGISHPRMYKQV